MVNLIVLPRQARDKHRESTHKRSFFWQGLWVSQNADSSSDDAAGAVPTFVRDDRYDFGHPSRVFFDPFEDGVVWASSFGSGLRRLSLA
eukprot:COSAG06_NODE_23733_length_683_cov_0.890411_1_plen_89_part_00